MATMFPSKDFEGFHVQNVWLPDGKSLNEMFLSRCAIIDQTRHAIQRGGNLEEGWSLLVIFPHDPTPEQAANVASVQARSRMETPDFGIGFVPGDFSAQ